MPSKDQGIGATILIGCVVGIIIYAYLVFNPDRFISLLVLKLTGFIAVGGILGIGAWIGWTMATTPPPKPIEEIEKELEEEETSEEKGEESKEEEEKSEAEAEK